MTTLETIPAPDAADRIATLIDITESLNLIFEEENEAIEEERVEDAAPLQEEKARLASAYAQSIRAVAADRASISSVDQAMLARLRAVTVTFEARAAHQRALLDETSGNHKDESATGCGQIA
ncbi:hypothetical protein ACFOOP_12460 [Marinicaulis aureus]|uniref:Uncharacterized protein n=1 Tax=Hyphococcus aureus TaxID=2666033 RepID=A0ABW1L2N2_9PROT